MRELKLKEAPYLSLVRRGDKFEARGTLQSTLGFPVYRADGTREGAFCSWRWDGETFQLETDPLGFYPVYYYSDSSRFVIAPSIARIAEVVPALRINHRSLAVFLRLGFFLDQNTAFENVFTVPPSAQVRLVDHQFVISGAPRKSVPVDRPRDQVVDGYVDLFRASVARRRPAEGAPFVVPLTGGRDSRHILFELIRQGYRPDECLTTFGFDLKLTQPEVDSAAYICKRLGLRHTIVHQGTPKFPAVRKTFRSTGFNTDEHNWYTPVAERLRSLSAVAYDGIAGDVLSSGVFLTDENVRLAREHRFEELARLLLGPATSIPSSRIRQFFCEDTVVADLARELRRHADSANPIGAYYFWNRTRREIALLPHCFLAGLPFVHTPFLDIELFDFLSSIPAELLLDRRVHTDAIARGYPELSDIAYSPTAGTLPRGETFLEHAAFAARTSLALLTSGGRGAVQLKHVLPRLARCLVDPSYASEAHWIGIQSLYLSELKRFSDFHNQVEVHQADGDRMPLAPVLALDQPSQKSYSKDAVTPVGGFGR